MMLEDVVVTVLSVAHFNRLPITSGVYVNSTSTLKGLPERRMTEVVESAVSTGVGLVPEGS